MILTLFSILILIFSVVVHEVAHGLVALWQGDPTAKNAGRLTLNPVSHIDPIGSIVVPILCAILPGSVILGWAKPVPFNIYNLRNRRLGEALVALAGPISNLLIALFLGLFMRFSGIPLQEHTYVLFATAIYINIVLAVFNLIPLPPLDGSRVVYALFPLKTAEILHRVEKYGFIVSLILVLAFIQLIQPIIDVIFSLIIGK